VNSQTPRPRWFKVIGKSRAAYIGNQRAYDEEIGNWVEQATDRAFSRTKIVP
jgi:hypothetical protein